MLNARALAHPTTIPANATWQPCRDVGAVGEHLIRACAPFGSVDELQIVTAKHRGHWYALCFLRLSPGAAEAPFVEALGGHLCDGRVALQVPLQPLTHAVQRRPSVSVPSPLSALGLRPAPTSGPNHPAQPHA